MGGDNPVQQGSEGAVRGVLHEPGHLLTGIAGRVGGARRGPLLLTDDAVKEEAMRQNCVALKYMDDGNVTMEYPMNPNGSEGAVVGLTSPIYRHL